MPLFSFKAERASGETYEGQRSAPDKFALYRDVKAEGGTVVSAREVKEKKKASLPFAELFSGISMHDRIIFARNLGLMVSAGLTLSRALSVIERQTRKKNLIAIVHTIAAQVNQGKSLSESLKSYPKAFSRLFVSMVKAGEESGSLPAALTSVSDQMNRVYLLQKKIRGAMIYPLIIIILMIAISIVMLIYVVPTLTSVFNSLHVDLPWNTLLIVNASTLMKDHSILMPSLIVGLAALLWAAAKSSRGKRVFDAVLIRLPVIKTIVQESNSARAARTLSSLLGSGVEVIQSLEVTAEVIQNSRFSAVLTQAKERVRKGEALSAVFAEHTKLYPPFVSEMVSIGEETGKLSEILANVATYYEGEVDQKTKDLSTIVEPVLMIIVGCAVGFFALSIIGPIYSLSGSIS